MPDNNPALRATLARQAQGIFTFQFTSSLTVGAVSNIPTMLAELSESDKLMIAGTEDVRAYQAVMVTTASLGAAVYTEGTPVTLDGDANWGIKRWTLSADGAVTTFTLFTRE